LLLHIHIPFQIWLNLKICHRYDIPLNLYSSLSVADIEGQDVMLDNKEIVTITNSNYRAFIQKSSSPEERKDIFEAVFSYYETHKNTYASIYKTVLDADLARVKARKYNSSLESYLFDNNIPTSVYMSLTKVARENTAMVKKYNRNKINQK